VMNTAPPLLPGYDIAARGWTMPTGQPSTGTFEQLFGDQPTAVVPVIPTQPPVVVPAPGAAQVTPPSNLKKLLMVGLIGAAVGGVVALATAD